MIKKKENPYAVCKWYGYIHTVCNITLKIYLKLRQPQKKENDKDNSTDRKE